MSGAIAIRGEKPFIPNKLLPTVIRAHEEATGLPLTPKSEIGRWVAEEQVPHALDGRRILVPADAPGVADAAKFATQHGSIKPSKFIGSEALLQASGMPQTRLDRSLIRKGIEPTVFVSASGSPLFERPVLEQAGLLTATGKGGKGGATQGAAALTATKGGGKGRLVLLGVVAAGALAAKAAVSATYPTDNQPTSSAAGWGAAGGIVGSAGAVAMLAKRPPAVAAEARGLARQLKGPLALGVVATGAFLVTSDNSPVGAAARMAGPAAVLTSIASIPLLIRGGHAGAAKDVLKWTLPVAGGAVAANVIGNVTSPGAPVPSTAGDAS